MNNVVFADPTNQEAKNFRSRCHDPAWIPSRKYNMEKLLGTMESPNFWFNIVTPNKTNKVIDQYKFN